MLMIAIKGMDSMLMELIIYVLLFVSIVLFVQIIAYSAISISNHRKNRRRGKWYPQWKKRLEDHLNGTDKIKRIEVPHKERKAFRDLLIFFYSGGNEENIPTEARADSPLAERKKRRLRILYREMGFVEDDLDQINDGAWWNKTVAFGRLTRLELNDAEDIALELITAKEQEVAISAVSYLSTIRSRYLPEHLGSIYQWNDPAIHKEITLELMRTNIGARHLKELSRDPVPAVRKAAAMLSGRKGLHSALDMLQSLTDDKDPEVRVEVARALGRIGGLRTMRILANMVEDQDKEVRSTVAESLGKNPDPEGINTLEKLAKDPEHDVKVKAFANLSRKGWEGKAAIIDLSSSDPEMGKEFV
jgi:hypothetical protein